MKPAEFYLETVRDVFQEHRIPLGRLRWRGQHMQAGVGHYGVFSGKRWTTQVYPIVRNLILAS
jgi:poly-beta-hydroxyalkanoate depolymerase